MVNHLFRLGPSKNHGYVTNNQMVTDFIHQFLTGAKRIGNGWVAGGCWDYY